MPYLVYPPYDWLVPVMPREPESAAECCTHSGYRRRRDPDRYYYQIGKVVVGDGCQCDARLNDLKFLQKTLVGEKTYY